MNESNPLSIACPACKRPAGEKCHTVVDGEDTGWTHDARYEAVSGFQMAPWSADDPDDTPDATASEPLSEGLTKAERTALMFAMCAPDPDRAPVTEIQLMYLNAAVERIVAAREAAAATRTRAEGAAVERERIAAAIEARRVPKRRDNTQGQIDTREALDLAARIARSQS